MKKNVLALSIATAVASFGVMGSAHAITAPLAGAATGLSLSQTGVGHILLVPYYTAQSTNATLINLTNTDSVNGKAVKVRFRAAANSDDVYDFQVFMSPSDMWTAKISVSASGVAQIETADNSCTKPAIKGAPRVFSTLRVDPTPTGSTAAKQTLEGYVEIFNMADIAPLLTGTASTVANPVYTGSLHSAAGVPSCALPATLDTDAATFSGLTYPTTGLTGSWTIINLATAAAFGGTATAIQATDSAGVATTGNIVYWPQTNVVYSAWPSSNVTADPLLAGNLTTGTSFTVVNVPSVLPLLQDLPDLSTPYYSTIIGFPQTQANSLATTIAATSVMNEFLVDSATLSIGAATDFVMSSPTRRYAVGVTYGTTAATKFNSLVSNHYSAANVTLTNRQACVFGLTPKAFNREEGTPSVVVSSPSAIPTFCGEVSVIGINQAAPTVTNVLSATVAIQGMDVTYNEGWLSIATPGLGAGLPVIGGSFTKAAAGASNFGVNFDHRYTRSTGL